MIVHKHYMVIREQSDVGNKSICLLNLDGLCQPTKMDARRMHATANDES